LREGVIETPFGHRRRFHLITDENIGDVRERGCQRRTPQNVAAWLTIEALSVNWLKEGVRVVATVHDSIVADVPEDEVERCLLRLMKRTMEEAVRGTTRLASTDDIPFLV
jgi:DNA polymerase I-like protein with 3'-5' exonuclease and polymerase domains